MGTKKTVFLTGASGLMGFMGFKEIYALEEKHDIVLLLLDEAKSRELFLPYLSEGRLRIVWGDLRNYEDVLSCVSGADVVLHVGGLVSPMADYYPKATFNINVTAAQNIVRAVKAQPNADDIRLMYVGTVAETGDRNPPIHWGRCGDPIKISVYDHYAISKTIAEGLFAESGLKHWVSLRQSGILHNNIANGFDPIMFHVPFRGVLEWATVEDSGTILARLCSDEIPEDFWRRFYNIGSGKQYRMTNYEFEKLLLETLGIGEVEEIFDPDWFVLRNFHGQWYADSDVLENYLHFRHNMPIREYFRNIKKALPAYYSLAKYAPKNIIKKTMMARQSKTPIFGTMDWIKTRDKERISAYYGSYEAWRAIGKDWSKIDLRRATSEVSYLDHGYDETKPDSELDITDMQSAAAFRGGECLSTSMVKGDLYTPLWWKCAHSHEFKMTPNSVLKGGHWCMEELPYPWDYDREAKVNPFFAQVWYPLHDKNENNYYDESIYAKFPEYETTES